jgi:hypothetical protein
MKAGNYDFKLQGKRKIGIDIAATTRLKCMVKSNINFLL